MKMIPAVILICIATTVTSAPTSQYTINVDGPEGRHVQMGEPGKAVSGYYTSRSLDGLMEYKTIYEADDKGYRATGDHLPVAAVLPAVRSLDSAPEGYVFRYEAPGSHSHYMMGQPGKSVQGSFTYVDAEGRSKRVDYEADEKGYRVLPIKEEEKPIEIASVSADAEVVIAAEPAIKVAAEPVPEVVAEPISEIVAEPVPAPVAVVEPIVDVVAAPVIEVAADHAPVAVAEEVEPVPEVVAVPATEVIAEPVVAVEPVASDPAPEAILSAAETVADAPTVTKTEAKAIYTLPVAYYSVPARIAQPLPAFPYPAPYSYAYSYNFGYPLTGGSYIYAL